MNNKSLVVVILILFLTILWSINLASKTNETYYYEQQEIYSALEYLNNGQFVKAEEILEKYMKNDRYKYSDVVNVNYLITLIQLNKTDIIDEYIEISYNSTPYLLSESNYLLILNKYMNGDNYEK